GAEKALFRHLKGEGKAPKYGILFGHPLIQQALKEQKGKVARLVAAKLSLAARLDRFSGKDQGESLRKELEESVRKIGK
ncbi:MAG: C/D box methylation guide ribonucleoprotein complex aNOP56 subunit, partial [Candidatus Aenigmarchaeota archaeon]|nr:C/D box methylation guide ribonucleoprotein complex aNOP56 subunit [Candidatus Aenigmarchaeota archaeon]